MSSEEKKEKYNAEIILTEAAEWAARRREPKPGSILEDIISRTAKGKDIALEYEPDMYHYDEPGEALFNSEDVDISNPFEVEKDPDILAAMGVEKFFQDRAFYALRRVDIHIQVIRLLMDLNDEHKKYFPYGLHDEAFTDAINAEKAVVQKILGRENEYENDGNDTGVSRFDTDLLDRMYKFSRHNVVSKLKEDGPGSLLKRLLEEWY